MWGGCPAPPPAGRARRPDPPADGKTAMTTAPPAPRPRALAGATWPLVLLLAVALAGAGPGAGGRPGPLAGSGVDSVLHAMDGIDVAWAFPVGGWNFRPEPPRPYAAGKCAGPGGKWVDLVEDMYAAADGVTDDTEKLRAALAELKAAGGGTVHFPEGRTFLIGPIVVSEPNVVLCVDGTIVAPPKPDFPDAECLAADDPTCERKGSPERRRLDYSYLVVSGARNVTITGKGAIDGNGEGWWEVRRYTPFVYAPVLVKIQDSAQVAFRGLRMVRSPFYHLVVLDSRDVSIEDVVIKAPEEAPNTDGVDILGSANVRIRRCSVDTGDDNCAIKEGSRNVLVENSVFAKGHGVSIGSLGEHGTRGEVENVRFENIVFNGTRWCSRVKTWQGGTGFVRNITYNKVLMQGVDVPLMIDQYYCPASQHPGPCAEQPAAVKISDVEFSDIRGVQKSGIAATLKCSRTVPCENVRVRNVYVKPAWGASNAFECDFIDLKSKFVWPAPRGCNVTELKHEDHHGVQPTKFSEREYRTFLLSLPLGPCIILLAALYRRRARRHVSAKSV